jgi:hypothetical protein
MLGQSSVTLISNMHYCDICNFSTVKYMDINHSSDSITSTDNRDSNREKCVNIGTIYEKLRDMMLSDVHSRLKKFPESDVPKLIILRRKVLCQKLLPFFMSL